MKIKKFTFNSFQENTYIVHSEKKCMIIDPGCNNEQEEKILDEYIKSNNLKPIHLINTHCHLDHIFGNRYIAEKYKLKAKMHKLDYPLLTNSMMIANNYGVNLKEPSFEVDFIDENTLISLGSTKWNIIFTPGHAPGHICLWNKKEKKIISGDVLFKMSIGRTDLPLCNYNDLIESIKNKLFFLEDETEVFCGHGENTTIGFEKKNNPFLQSS